MNEDIEKLKADIEAKQTALDAEKEKLKMMECMLGLPPYLTPLVDILQNDGYKCSAFNNGFEFTKTHSENIDFDWSIFPNEDVPITFISSDQNGETIESVEFNDCDEAIVFWRKLDKEYAPCEISFTMKLTLSAKNESDWKDAFIDALENMDEDEFLSQIHKN